MPPFGLSDVNYFRDHGRDWFAYLPTWTIHGWVWLDDVVEIHTFTFESGWKTHRERLRGR